MEDFIILIYVASMLVTGILTTLGTPQGEAKVKEMYPGMGDKAVTSITVFSNFITVFMPVLNTGMVFYAAIVVLRALANRG